MVKIDGVSLIDRQLSVLKSEGLENIVMIGGYKSEMLKFDGVKLRKNPRYYETNMVWTLFSAEDELNDNSEIIVSYGDIVYSKGILKSLLASKDDISVVIDKNWENYWRMRNDNPLHDAETLRLGAKNSIVEIGKKPHSLNEIEGQYIGLMKFTPAGIEQMKNAFNSAVKIGKLQDNLIENSYMTDLLQYMIDLGCKVTAVPVYENWVEVDTVQDLELDETLQRVKSIELSDACK
jgi:choline kinase